MFEQKIIVSEHAAIIPGRTLVEKTSSFLMHRRLAGLSSGSGRYFLEMCDCLQKSGHKVRIVLAPVTGFAAMPVCRVDPVLAERGITVDWPGTLRIGRTFISLRRKTWLELCQRLKAGLRKMFTHPTRQKSVYPSKLGEELSAEEASELAAATNAVKNDVVVAEYSSLAPVLAQCEAKQRVVLLHDLFSCRAESFRDLGLDPDHYAPTREEEAQRLKAADICVHSSVLELEAMKSMVPASHHVWMRPTFAPNPGFEGALPRALFVGTKHGGNRSALELILYKIWPRVRNKVKDDLWIVGEVCDWVVGEHEGVKCVRFVEDLRSLGREGTVALAPMSAASGISIKLATYLELGMRVLTFADNLDAYGDKMDGYVTTAETVDEMVEALIDMLNATDVPAQSNAVYAELTERLSNTEIVALLQSDQAVYASDVVDGDLTPTLRLSQ